MMQDTAGYVTDPQAANRRPVRRMRQHALATHAQDPVSRAKRKSLLAPGNLAMLVFMAGFGLYATGNLGVLDRLFDRVHLFGRRHNDAIVHSILYYLPVVLVLSAASVLLLAAARALRSRFSETGRHVDATALDPALPEILRTSVHHGSFGHTARVADPIRPVRIAMEPVHESLPRLPVRARVRRRHPNGKLPPQVAAALQAAAAAARTGRTPTG